MKNFNNKVQILEERRRQNDNVDTLKEFVELEAANDPGFFRWLFDSELEQDFDTSLTDQQRAEYEEFVNNL